MNSTIDSNESDSDSCFKIVRLSVPEVQYAMAIATQRDACKGNMRESRIKKGISGFGVHFAGIIGELCFRKVYGGKINTEILPNGDGHTADVILDDGRKVEVKTSLFKGIGAEIKFEQNEVGKIEHCCLVQVSMPDTGKVSRIWSFDEIRPKLMTKNYGYGERLAFSPYL